MSSNDESRDYSESFSYEDELAKARWYNEDLNNGGWREIKKDERATYYIKRFSDNEIPIKVLAKHQMPLSAEQFLQVTNPTNMEYRKQWDRAFYGHEVVEEYPSNRGHVIANRINLPWPLSDREFVLFLPPSKEVDWYGKRAFLVVYVNASHPSIPANQGRFVRATNGGQFFIVTPDTERPNEACTVFALSHNLFNGNIPSTIERLYASTVPKAFGNFFESVVEGYERFFANRDQ